DPSAWPVLDVRALGAKGDGKTDDTKAIQAAIDRCPPTGGIVGLPAGTYLSGMIRLKSNIVFRLEQGATLKGTLDRAAYPDTAARTTNSQLSNCRKTLIYAEGADNVTIEGPGTIDGGGDAAQWSGKEATRPMAIYTTLSSNVTIENINVKNAAMWA